MIRIRIRNPRSLGSSGIKWTDEFLRWVSLFQVAFSTPHRSPLSERLEQANVEWIHRFLCNFMIWLFELVCCAFHWDDLDQDQWSEITQVIAHQGNWQIHPGKDSLSVHLVCYDPSDPYPDHPKWMHSMFTPRAYSRKSCNFFYFCHVCIQDHSFNNFENDTMKLSASALGTVLATI